MLSGAEKGSENMKERTFLSKEAGVLAVLLFCVCFVLIFTV